MTLMVIADMNYSGPPIVLLLLKGPAATASAAGTGHSTFSLMVVAISSGVAGTASRR